MEWSDLVLPTFWQSTQKPCNCDQTPFFAFYSSPSSPSPLARKTVFTGEAFHSWWPSLGKPDFGLEILSVHAN